MMEENSKVFMPRKMSSLKKTLRTSLKDAKHMSELAY